MLIIVPDTNLFRVTAVGDRCGERPQHFALVEDDAREGVGAREWIGRRTSGQWIARRRRRDNASGLRDVQQARVGALDQTRTLCAGADGPAVDVPAASAGGS